MNVQLLTVQNRLEELGFSFMASGLESYLEEAARRDRSLLETVADLVDLEYLPRKERAAKSRVKLSGLPAVKRLEDFDLSWPKGGLSSREFEELSSLSFIDRKETSFFSVPVDSVRLTLCSPWPIKLVSAATRPITPPASI